MSEKILLTKKQFDRRVKTLRDMELKIKDYLLENGTNNTAMYSDFYKLFSSHRRGLLRDLLYYLEQKGTLATRWRRDPGQPPVKIYSLPEVDAHENPQEFQDKQ